VENDIWKWIHKRSEELGAVKEVSTEYYEDMINASDKGLKLLLKAILVDRAEQINQNLFSDRWDDNDLFEFIKQFLWFFFYGEMSINDTSFKLVFSKPVGPPPDKNLKDKFERKLKSIEPLIVEVLESLFEDGSKVEGRISRI